MILYYYAKENYFSIEDTDLTALTWHHLIRMTFESRGGQMTLAELYVCLASHPKAKKNTHFRERIRATIYEHKDQYISCGNGSYRLSYQVA